VTDRDLEFWVLVGALFGAFILIHFWEPPVEFEHPWHPSLPF
jgi:hypothetical protein